jgi:hypothetical protein
MVDVTAIAGTVSALKGATDIAKAMVGLRDAKVLQAKVLELNAKILEAQSSAFVANEERSALIERVRELEEEMARLKAWGAEKERYELKELRRGLFAYILKEGKEEREPPHALCATCYQRGIKSFLQTSGDQMVHDHSWKCPTCGFSAKNQFRNMAELIKKSRELTQS